MLSRMLARRAVLAPLPLTLALTLAACGGPPPAPPASPAPKPVTNARVEPPAPDVSEVPEPPMMIGVARIKSADTTLKTLNGWLRLPVALEGKLLVNEVFDADVADVIDTTQAVDAALSVGGSILTKPTAYAAVALPVRSIDHARAKLEAAGMKVSAKEGGQWLVENVSGSARKAASKPASDESAEDEETTRPRRRSKDDVICTLMPAAPPGAARLVCGEPKAVDALGPWLARSAPRKSYPSDLHLELRPIAVREPLLALKAMVPSMLRSLGGSHATPVEQEVIEAGANELADLATDIDRVTIDGTLEGDAVNLVTRVEHGKAVSTTAKVAVAQPERADAPPASFWKLPGDAEMAAFGRGADPKLLERPRKLVASLVAEEMSKTAMPEPERKVFEDLFANRSLPLAFGPMVYAKGSSEAGLTKARELWEKANANPEKRDPAAVDRAEMGGVAQGFGWHVANVQEPVSKVGPLLREWAQLWAKPGLAKWKKEKGVADLSARITPAAAALKLPKDTVHLELVVKREPGKQEQWDAKTKSMKTVKTWKRDPVTFHVYAVPDAGTTWLGLAFDDKLVGDKLASIASGNVDASLARAPAFQGLRDLKANSAYVTTLRGFTSFARMSPDASLEKALVGLPAKGTTALPFVVRAEAPSAGAPAGTTVTTVKVPRAFLEDVVRLAMQR